MFLLGTAFYSVWSVGIGFAPNAVGALVMRGLQGLGCAAFVPAGLGVLAHSFPPGPAKSLAFATFSAGAPTGACFGLGKPAC